MAEVTSSEKIIIHFMFAVSTVQTKMITDPLCTLRDIKNEIGVHITLSLL